MARRRAKRLPPLSLPAATRSISTTAWRVPVNPGIKFPMLNYKPVWNEALWELSVSGQVAQKHNTVTPVRTLTFNPESFALTIRLPRLLR